MMKYRLAAAAALILVPITVLAQADERTLYASVVDQKGSPVSGLTAKDFIVREDGQAREVLRVAADDEPLQIALLVDNSAEMRNQLTDLRRAIAAFVGALRPGIEVSIITLAERPTTVVPYTNDKTALQKGIDRVITYNAGNYLLDGIAEVAQGLAKRTSARSAIAVITGRGPEYSYRDYTDVLRIVRESGTPALHVMIVGALDAQEEIADRSTSVYEGQRDTTGAERDILLGRLTKDTGGRYEEVLAPSALTRKTQQMASELSNQYRVTFARPQRLVPPKKTEISVRDRKLKARGMLQAR
jgi:VWFA-related protein